MTENEAMTHIRAQWARRCKTLDLRPRTKKRDGQLEAFLEGAMSALVATGTITETRAAKIGFLVMVGRGEAFLAQPKEGVTA